MLKRTEEIPSFGNCPFSIRDEETMDGERQYRVQGMSIAEDLMKVTPWASEPLRYVETAKTLCDLDHF